ncbi:hypothetical protein EVJ24_14945 [Exiguobacterium sp. SH1S21]|uniref:hypothetical protein n=1 Tax=Exiguobacterium sp. SH1S21 TaxID=2510953 RepID=UPI00103EA469|nr:hypothetical protein [Exiguobacterium sp. SH1S21]TCI50303.1 hypothetical protein EVJ24_14945 [Exiguobacterium sp. SH1S21]
MDSFEMVSLSKIATVLNNQVILPTNNNSMWERILSNAGYSGLYDAYEYQLNPYSYRASYQNENPRFTEFYSVMKRILNTSYSNGGNIEGFTALMSEIVSEINIVNIFREGFWDDSTFIDDFELERSLKDGNPDVVSEVIVDGSNDDFKTLSKNLNVFNLDVKYANGKFKLIPFTESVAIVPRNPSSIDSWLTHEYPEIAELYQEAIENYIAGENVSCISNCRSIITGLFSHFKDDGDIRWLKGLRNLSTDTHIEEVKVPNNIMKGTADNGVAFQTDDRFEYSRFKLFYQLYSTTSNLGPHITEGPKIDGKLYRETVSNYDALLCLRMTEDTLVWVKERLKTYNRS